MKEAKDTAKDWVVRRRVVDASAVSTPVGEFATSEDGVDGTWCATSVLGAETTNILVLKLKLQDFTLIGLSRKGAIPRNSIMIEVPEGRRFLEWGYSVGLYVGRRVQRGGGLGRKRGIASNPIVIEVPQGRRFVANHHGGPRATAVGATGAV